MTFNAYVIIDKHFLQETYLLLWFLLSIYYFFFAFGLFTSKNVFAIRIFGEKFSECFSEKLKTKKLFLFFYLPPINLQ